MNETVAKLTGLSLLLIVVWIIVYWLTPSEPRITFADIEGERDASLLTGEPPKKDGGERPAPIEPPPRRVELPPAVLPPEFIDHIVQKNESFESIAKKYFGPKAGASIIAKANPFVDPLRIQPGRVLRIPKDPGNIQGVPTAPVKPEVSPRTTSNTYVVKSGDSLSKIASKVYGDSRMAKKIFDANKDRMKNIDSLKVGQELIIPDVKPE
jgi:nucleoid-associated protein YgaU